MKKTKDVLEQELKDARLLILDTEAKLVKRAMQYNKELQKPTLTNSQRRQAKIDCDDADQFLDSFRKAKNKLKISVGDEETPKKHKPKSKKTKK